jgi:hypothetical protein
MNNMEFIAPAWDEDTRLSLRQYVMRHSIKLDPIYREWLSAQYRLNHWEAVLRCTGIVLGNLSPISEGSLQVWIAETLITSG